MKRSVVSSRLTQNGAIACVTLAPIHKPAPALSPKRDEPAGLPRQLPLFTLLLGMGMGIMLFAAPTAHAQNFSVDWPSIDGGGGTSAGGPFSLSGTIGQADAGVTMTNGGFALTGGFWSIFAVQTPAAPRLTITRVSATSARVSWPAPSPGFVLQEKSDLPAANWVNVAQAVSDNGTTRSVSVNAAAGRRFYRLFKP